MAWLFLVLWLVAYTVTPLSDRNGPIRHNLLYGGQTIRLALPAVLLAVVMLARAAPGWLEGAQRRARWWFWGVVIVSVINLFWFDLLALAVKPESAFAAQAAALRSFDNRILLAFTMLIWVVALLGAWRRRRIVLTTLVVLCVLLYYGGYPRNLSYTSRFKRVGQTTEVFRFLDRHDHARTRVALHSTAGSFFLSIMNGYLLDSADHVKLVEDVSTAQTADLLVVCAGNQWESGDMVRGLKYRQSLSFWKATSLPQGFRRVYDDAFYLVYVRERGGPALP